jgi:hypothetical protein
LAGEFLKIYEEEGISKVRWAPAAKDIPVTWYRVHDILYYMTDSNTFRGK